MKYSSLDNVLQVRIVSAPYWCQVSSLICSETLRFSPLLLVLLLLLIKMWRQVSKNGNRWTVLKHVFEKWKVMLRKPGASFGAVKPEHIIQI